MLLREGAGLERMNNGKNKDLIDARLSGLILTLKALGNSQRCLGKGCHELFSKKISGKVKGGLGSGKETGRWEGSQEVCAMAQAREHG